MSLLVLAAGAVWGGSSRQVLGSCCNNCRGRNSALACPSSGGREEVVDAAAVAAQVHQASKPAGAGASGQHWHWAGVP